MAISRGAAREAQAGHMQLERLNKITATKPDVEEGYTLDPKIAETIKRLPGYLQPMVILIVTMVPPSEESNMREKRGREALAQAMSMMLMVSVPLP